MSRSRDSIFQSLGLQGVKSRSRLDKLLQCDPNLTNGKPEFAQLSSTDELNLASFINQKSWLLFSFFKRPCSFWLATSVELWANDEGYKTLKLVVQSLNVVNDTAE